MSAVHLHLMLNHIPILLLWLGSVTLLISLPRPWPDLRHYAVLLLLVGALCTIPVYLTGNQSESLVEQLPLAADSETFIETHESAAKNSLLTAGLTGLLAFYILLRTYKKQETPKTLSALLLLAALAAATALTWTGYLGGQIRHTEVRPHPTTTPAQTEKPSNTLEH